MKTVLPIKEYDLPKPYNLEAEMHKACREGNTFEISKLLYKEPCLVDIRDEKVF